MAAPASWQGKTIRALELRSRCGVNVIALRRGEKIIIPPPIDDPLTAEEALVILGDYKMLNKLRSNE
jgi:trk system potassium uptake protein TrkA